MPSEDYPDLSRHVTDPHGDEYEVLAYAGHRTHGFLRWRSSEVPIVGVLSLAHSGTHQLHAEPTENEADAAAVIDRIVKQIETGSFMPLGTELLD